MNRQHDLDIRFYAIAASLLLSLLHGLLNTMPNADAFEYVRIAQISLDEGVAAAFARYPSATYPVLIGLIHQMSGADLFVAAQILNAGLYALVVSAYMALTAEIRDGRRLAVLAAITVLVFPQLNEYRYYVIRDIGFLGFMLLGLLYLTRYIRLLQLRNLLLFCGATVVAALFRSEALAWLLAGPLVLLCRPGSDSQTRFLSLLKAEGLIAALGLAGIVLAALAGIDVLATLQRIVAVYVPFLRDAALAISAATSPMSTAVFGEYAADYSGQYLWLFMVSGLGAILVLKLFTGFGVPALLILGYGLRFARDEWRHPALRPALWYAVIAFVMMLGFLLLARFLSTRYTLLFCTLLLLAVPLIIDSALHKARSTAAEKSLRTALALLLAFCTIDAHISFGAPKTAVRDASAWLRTHSVPGQTVVTNNTYLAYHSQRVPDYDAVSHYVDAGTISAAPGGALLAMSLDRGVDELLDESVAAGEIEPVAVFPASGEAEFGIYRRLATATPGP